VPYYFLPKLQISSWASEAQYLKDLEVIFNKIYLSSSALMVFMKSESMDYSSMEVS
jgi:hypothetical protein